MEKQFLKLPNGETIAYLKNGSGEKTIIAIHGNMASSIFMKPFFELKNYTVICPDLRGYGDSSYNKPVESMQDFAEDVYSLCNILKIKSAYVLGWSLGGGVAMTLAGLHPEFVEKLVLISSASCMGYQLFGQEKDGSFYPYKTKQDMKFSSAVFGNLQALECGNSAYFDAAFRSVIYTVCLPEKEEYNIQLQETLKQRNLLDADWALANLNITPDKSFYCQGNNLISNISCPVLLTSGDKDFIVFPFMTDQNIQYFGDKLKHIKYTNSGHAPFVDKKQEFFKDLLDFFGDSKNTKVNKSSATKSSSKASTSKNKTTKSIKKEKSSKK